MRKNRCLWGALIAGLALLFLFTLQQVFLILAAAVVFLPVLSAGCNRAVSGKLEIELACRKTEKRGTVQVYNKALLGIPGLVLEIQIQNLLTMETWKKQFICAVGGRSRESETVVIPTEHCGCMEITVSDVCLLDIWGIFPIHTDHEARARMNIWPDIFEQQIVVGKSSFDELDSMEYSTEKPGSDPGEMFDIRDYMPGDRLSSIHWKLSGKYDRLMVVRPGFPLENSILLLFETGYTDRSRRADPRRIDAAARVFLSVSRNLLSAGMKHRVGWVDGFSGQFLLCDIASEEDFAGVAPKLLAAGYMEQDGNAWLKYVQLSEGREDAHIVYVAHEFPEGMEYMESPGIHMTLLLSDGSEAETPGDHVDKLGFCEEGYEQELYELNI